MQTGFTGEAGEPGSTVGSRGTEQIGGPQAVTPPGEHLLRERDMRVAHDYRGRPCSLVESPPFKPCADFWLLSVVCVTDPSA